MHYGSPYSRLVAALIGAILVSVAPGLEAAAQKSKKGSSQTAPSNPLLWENPRTIVQVKKPGHRTRPGRPRRERKPYLAVRLRLLILGEDGKENPTSPETVFHPGDRLRLAVKANQDGYLYIIYQAAPDQDGERLYPDSRVDYGQNFFRKNQEVTVPTTCRGNISPCAYVVTPVNVKEQFTIIFSRDDITALSGAGTRIKPQMIADLRRSQKLADPNGRAVEGYWKEFVNINPKDNEEIVISRSLNKGDRATSQR